MTNKPLTLGVVVAALLMMAGGRANASNAPAAAPIDPVAVTLTSPADVAATRTALIEETWGMTTLPATLPTVTTIANPFGSTLPDVGEVFDYHAAVSNGQVNDSNLYLNSSPNGQVVIMNMGHQGTPIPSDFSVVLDDTAQSHQFSDPFYVNLTVNTLLSNAAVPEPPTWTMLLPGLGFVGYLQMRRGKRQRHDVCA